MPDISGETGMNFFGRGLTFLICYCLLLVPLYQLPLHANAAATSLFGAHLSAYVVLSALTWARGYYIEKEWIAMFPVMAGVFGLLVPVSFLVTLFHILALSVGLVFHVMVKPSGKRYQA